MRLLTVGKLKELLAEVPDEARVAIALDTEGDVVGAMATKATVRETVVEPGIFVRIEARP